MISIHTCVKFGKDIWKTVTCIEELRTNKQMKGQSEIAYLPKFAKMYILPIVLVIVITE